MINTSAAYKQNIRTEIAGKWHVKGVITFASSQVYELRDADFWDSAVKINDSVSKPSAFEVGQAAVNEMTLTLQNFDGRFNYYNFLGAKIQLFIGMKLPDKTIEWLNKGIWTVDEPVTVSDVITISTVDNMSLFDRDYDTKLSYPATIGQIVRDACEKCGVQLATLSFWNDDYVVSVRPEDEATTYRDIISYAAQIAACWARCDNLGRLVLGWYDMDRFHVESGDVIDGNAPDNADILDGGPFYPTAPTTDGGSFVNYIAENTADGGSFTDYSEADMLDGGDFIDYGTTPGEIVSGGVFRKDITDPTEIQFINSKSVGLRDTHITGVRVIVGEDEEYFKGTRDYVVTIQNNTLIQDNPEYVAYRIAQKVIDLKFRSMEISALDDPSIEAGDVVYAAGHMTIVSNLNYSITGLERFSADAESETANQSQHYSASAKTVRTAKIQTSRQIDRYDQMNALASLAIGMYRSWEKLSDGSEIIYLHDKPLRENSVHIWKMTANGIFISHNGGVTYENGIDSEGNGNFNMLSAVGFLAQWIICGGSGVNGQFKIRDSEDNEILILDNRGITMQNGAKLMGGNGVLSTFISTTAGYYPGGFSVLGWIIGGGMPQRDFLYHYVYVPDGFIVTRATLYVEVMSKYLTNSGSSGPKTGWYTVSNIKASALTDASQMYMNSYYQSEARVSAPTGDNIAGFGTWSPPAVATLQQRSVDVTSYLATGKRTLFAIQGGANTSNDYSDITDSSWAKMTVAIEGYKS